MIAIHKIEMDFGKPREQLPIRVMQGDENSRCIEITITNNGVAWECPDGAQIRVSYRKTDGTRGIYDTLPDGFAAGSISGNVITVFIAPQILTVAGKIPLAVSLMDGSTILSTFPVMVQVNALPGYHGISEDYINWSTWTQSELNRMLAEAQESGELDGPKGDTGRGSVSVTGNADGSWTFAYTDGTKETVSSAAYNVLLARMNTFAALPDGSTSGDAERAGIRVDFEGNTHATAGEAVRVQVSQLSAKIDNVKTTIGQAIRKRAAANNVGVALGSGNSGRQMLSMDTADGTKIVNTDKINGMKVKWAYKAAIDDYVLVGE